MTVTTKHVEGVLQREGLWPLAVLRHRPAFEARAAARVRTFPVRLKSLQAARQPEDSL